jgi:hypothetical protein
MRQQRVRLAVVGAIGAGAVVAAVLTVPTYAGFGDSDSGDSVATAHEKDVSKRKEAKEHKAEEAAFTAKYGEAAEFIKAVGEDDGHGHSHAKSARDNDISRSSEAESVEAADPTTEEQAEAGRRTVAEQRDEPDPRLAPASLQAPRYERPRTRYEMAGACYGVRSASDGRWLTRTGDDLVTATADDESDAEPFFFQATDLGSFLLYGTEEDFLDGKAAAVTLADEPGPSADWTVQRPAEDRFTFEVPDGFLTAGPGGTVVLGDAGAAPQAQWSLEQVDGCTDYPEVEVNVTGEPHQGTSSFQQVHGLTDAHTHQMAFRFLGGELHCGKPWDRYGAPYALVDCDDHEMTDGKGALVEAALSGRPTHDPTGWPTFKDWPAPRSLTHEGTYYKWMERAWRGGLRVFTNLLVENNKLCELYPLTATNEKWQQAVASGKKLCDDMVSLKWQADDMRDFERYVDAQFGGPGRGWYRIVTDPFEARRVINSGRLAVVMGIETSMPFECKIGPGNDDTPTPLNCDAAKVNAWLDEVQRWGVRQMELVNKFDNAFSGIAGDEAEIGLLVNSANFAETGSHWRMKTCTTAENGGDPDVRDKNQPLAAPAPPEEFDSEQQDALFAAVAKVSSALPLAPAPAYPPHPHCNKYGLSDLGDHVIRQMAERNMLFDPDHMSVKARQAALDLVESLDYPGILSSHSWSTPDAYPRILRLGGFIAPYAGDSDGFVEKWERVQTWADPRYFFGVGFGADINGLGAQGDPRNPGEDDDVDYPFTGLGGVTVDQQRSGERVYDINTDGVAHYGLYPDWLEDLKVQAGQPIVDDLARGAEAYLQTWERATGVGNDACRQPELRKKASFFTSLGKGTTVRQVLERAGQPNQRLDRTFTYCAERGKKTVRMDVEFTADGRLSKVRNS